MDSCPPSTFRVSCRTIQWMRLLGKRRPSLTPFFWGCLTCCTKVLGCIMTFYTRFSKGIPSRGTNSKSRNVSLSSKPPSLKPTWIQKRNSAWSGNTIMPLRWATNRFKNRGSLKCKRRITLKSWTRQSIKEGRHLLNYRHSSRLRNRDLLTKRSKLTKPENLIKLNINS